MTFEPILYVEALVSSCTVEPLLPNQSMWTPHMVYIPAETQTITENIACIQI